MYLQIEFSLQEQVQAVPLEGVLQLITQDSGGFGMDSWTILRNEVDLSALPSLLPQPHFCKAYAILALL